MISGSFTAIITPFKENAIDYGGLSRLIDFQIANGITGILAVGTTGESPTLTWEEHNRAVETVASETRDKCVCLAGTGSNNTSETLSATKHAIEAGAEAVLLVDPYYNGPSSIEIRKEYYEPVAVSFPEIDIIPYVIPGRTGAQLLPEDLAILKDSCKNVNTVKEATGDLENMKRTRECCGQDFSILSGDDGITYQMMVTPEIKAGGVISVASNIIPGAVVELVSLLRQGDQTQARCLLSKIEPLFNLVTVKTKEKTSYGEVVFRARNPLAVKTLMAILGLPSGGCRRPLGKMTKKGLDTVLDAARKVQTDSPEIFQPVADFFGVDIDERLNTPSNWKGLCYKEY